MMMMEIIFLALPLKILPPDSQRVEDVAMKNDEDINDGIIIDDDDSLASSIDSFQNEI